MNFVLNINFFLISIFLFLPCLTTPSQPASLGEWDLRDLFGAVSVEAAHGHGQNITYHEYVAAVMHDRFV